MSSRTASRFALTVWLAAALAAPAAAQESRPVAPMPRAKVCAEAPPNVTFTYHGPGATGALAVPLSKPGRPDLRYFSQFDVTALGTRGEQPVSPAVAPMPRAKRPSPDVRLYIGYFDFGPELRDEPVPPMAPPTPPVFPAPAANTTEYRIALPPLGPLPINFDFAPLAQTPNDQRQIFNFSIGVFGEKPAPSPFGCGFGSYCCPTLPQLMSPVASNCVVPTNACTPPQFLKYDPLGWSPQPINLTPFTPSCGNAIIAAGWTAPAVYPPVAAVTQAPANALCGTWYRELAGYFIVATFTADELKLRVTLRDDEGHAAIATITAHYTLTKDGLVYGAITSADVEMKNDPKSGDSPFESHLIDDLTVAQASVDMPFSFRAKMTSAGLMVSGMKCGSPMDERMSGVQGMFGGLYKPAKNGVVPAPTAIKAKPADPGPAIGGALEALIGKPRGGKCDCGYNPADYPIAAPTSPYVVKPQPRGAVGPLSGAGLFPPLDGLERVGVDFNTNPPTMIRPQPPGAVVPPQPADTEAFGPAFLSKIPYLNRLFKNAAPELPCPPPMPKPVTPIGFTVPGDSSKQMAVEAFGQMFQQSGGFGTVPPVGKCDVYTVPARPLFGGRTLPSGRYLDGHYPQYFDPSSASSFPLPRELVSQEDPEGAARRAGGPAPMHGPYIPTPATPSFIGTWLRDVAGKQCVVKVTAGHLTLTVAEAHDEGGKVSTASLVITADYHLNRDGVTAVGLITGVDVSFDGEFPHEDAKPFFDMLTGIQKALEDKPFALTFRPYDGALVIGNVRMPEVTGNAMEVQPSGYLAGRYKAVTGAVPKPKPLKGPAIRELNIYSSDPNVLKALPQPVPDAAYPERYNHAARERFIAPFTEQRHNGSPLPPGTVPVSPNGDTLPPQAVPVEPRVIPSGATTVPQMPMPTPPGELRSEAKTVMATDLAVGWQPRIVHQPDPVRGGRMSPGLAGQMFLFGGPKLDFAPANGTITVDLVDETPRPAGQPAATPERFQFDAATLAKLVTENRTFGKCYALFLPWPAYKPDITKVKLTVRYDPDNGPTLFAVPTTITLEPAKPDAELRMPQPTPPGPVVEAVAPAKPGKKKAKPSSDPNARMNELLYQSDTSGPIGRPLPQQYSSDPNVRMQQRLYRQEGDDGLYQIHNEWRRFWFNDVPPEPMASPTKPGKKKVKPSSNPNAQIPHVPYESEDLRQITSEWRRFWFPQSGHTTERIHGGIY